MSRLGRAQPVPPQFTTRPPQFIPQAGFDFDTASGLIFGDLSGSSTGLTRQASVGMVVRVHAVSGGAVVATSGTLTTDAGGRLARWTDPALVASTTYHLFFIRNSDGEIACVKMAAT